MNLEERFNCCCGDGRNCPSHGIMPRIMTPQQQAEALAMKAAVTFSRKRVFSEITLKADILSTIPLVELLECVKALRDCSQCFQGITNKIDEAKTLDRAEAALTNLDAKLKELNEQ